MNLRQHFIETLTFGHPDKIPFMPGHGRESTLERWHREGLPTHITNPILVNDYAYKQVGGKESLPLGGEGFYVKESFVSTLLKKTFHYIVPDSVHISEDMGGLFDAVAIEVLAVFAAVLAASLSAMLACPFMRSIGTAILGS